MDKFLVARQSIYDKSINVRGYALLFKDPDNVEASDHAVPDNLDVSELANAFTDQSMQQLMGDGLVFIQFSVDMLDEDIPAEFPNHRLVITVDGRETSIDEDVVAELKKYKSQGFKISVRGFSSDAELIRLTKIADIIQLDTSSIDADKLAKLAEALNEKKVVTFATHIQTHEEFDRCKSLNFSYFSGYFLDLPKLDNTKKVSSNRLTTMRLLVSLDDPDISVDVVEELISQDARLGYRLLKAVNSAAYGLPKTVSSLREAVVFLGLKQIRSWTSMVVITCQDEKPSDLLLTTMIRARMCELIAEDIGADDTKSFFTVGLFSTLDAILDKNMADLLDELNLTDTLRQALLAHEGDLGAVLENVIAYGHGKWEELADSGIDMGTWRNAYMQSVNWATTSFNQLRAES